MQLYALENDHFVLAAYAKPHQNYKCPECGGILRRRAGFHYQPHFFHTHSKSSCSQNKKSLEHLQTQIFFKKHLPKDEVFLEKRFSEISRIADVVWENKKIVFEIQCSNITIEELKSRNESYASIGYRVIWILHDKIFARAKKSFIEYFLQKNNIYCFTNMKKDGAGYLYRKNPKNSSLKIISANELISLQLHDIENLVAYSKKNIFKIVYSKLCCTYRSFILKVALSQGL